MVQFIERPKSFGDLIAEGIGQGAGAGIQQFQQLAMQSFLEKQKQAERLKNIKEIRSRQGEGADTQFQPKDYYQEAEEFALADEPQLSKISLERGKQERKESFAREQAGETKLQELGDKLEAYEQSGLRFDRLNNLFSPDLEDKFPPSVLAAAFTKDGELRPVAAATLSPEAQEAVKLVTDEIKGAKETFGARVTNFDAQTYLKTLPGLLNTPEGRSRVLRDLRIMNRLNQMQSSGVLGIVEEYGGPGKISISKAKGIFDKRFSAKKAQYRKAFVNPKEFPFTELDDFNASIYPGVTIEDPETGQSFESDGQTWIPQ